MKCISFIDGQNLHLGTIEDGWKINFKKFRIYLKDKYSVEIAYYFLGYISDKEQELYDNLVNSGFILIFKIHNKEMQAKKKGNVDTDIVFEIMKNIIEDKNLDNIILVSGDGDYKKVTDYLINQNKFKKILFPNKKFASSLYKELGSEYFDYLSNVRKHIEHR